MPLNAEVTARLINAGLPTVTPARGDNGNSGNNTTPGTKTGNVTQQQFFVDSLTKAILPLFAQRKRRFVIVYWSRDPDGTQHNQGDSLNSYTPGINGPTSLAAVKNADNNLAQIVATLRNLGLDRTTDIFVTADHGFNTINKQSATSYAAKLSYPNVTPGFLPPGFVAIDIARGLGLPLYDPDQNYQLVTPGSGTVPRPANGDAAIGSPTNPDVVVAANGGSDLIYLTNPANRVTRAQQVVNILLQQDYISGIFVDDALGAIPGTLPLSAINLRGAALTPTPAIAISFRTFNTGCGNPNACSVEVADTGLQQGQGMHGTFSRADTYNYMAASGPDFKTGFVDPAPVSNVDVAVTVAQILFSVGAPPVPSKKGSLVGRVISEALVNGPSSVSFSSQTLTSQPAFNGLSTVLKYQVLGSTKYFDVAGFPGRTTGL